MYEPKEFVNMLATIAFFLYFLVLYKSGRCKYIPPIWLFGVFLVTIVNIASVIEGLFFYNFFNFTEHLLYTIACACFLTGTIQLKPQSEINNL